MSRMASIARRTITALATTVAALLVVSGCDRGDTAISLEPTHLVFAAVPEQQSAQLQKKVQPILEMLQKESGREVRFLIASSYDAVIEGLLKGDIDVADLGPFPYVQARSRGARITAVAARVTGNRPGYRAYGIARPGSTIKSLADFRGKRVCFVDRSSTSGYLYPKAGLLAQGIDPEKDLTPVFVGGHDASVVAVAGGRCDAGFAYDTMVDHQLIERQQIQAGQITTVWRSGTIPGAPLAIATDLPEEVRTQLTSAIRTKANVDYLRANGYCQAQCALDERNADQYSFVAVDDAFYDDIRQVWSSVIEASPK
jgi:phosphonate transport system substrate-binding protein